MLKLLLLGIFLTNGFSAFASDSLPISKSWEINSLFYLESGNTQLLMHKPVNALEDFQTATAFLDKSDKSASVIAFLISFGQTIAYDAIGDKEQCKQSLGSLLFSINAYDEFEDDEVGDKTGEIDILISTDYQEVINFLRELVNIAPSQEVREILLSFIEEMSEEVLPAFKLADRSFSNASDWRFDYGQDAYIDHCKSFWKKIKKFFREAAEVMKYIAAGCKSAKEIKDTYDAWKNQEEQNI